MQNDFRNNWIKVAAATAVLLASLVPIPGASAAPQERSSSVLSVSAARLEVERSEQRLEDATAALEASKVKVAALEKQQAALTTDLADARSAVRTQAIATFVSDAPDSTTLALLGGDDLFDVSARSQMLQSSTAKSHEVMDRYLSLKESTDPELFAAATELSQLEKELVDANNAALQARANEAQAERDEEKRQIAARAAAARAEQKAQARSALARSASTTASPTATGQLAATHQTAGTTPSAPVAAKPLPPAPLGGPTEAQWARLRHCEATGNYRAINPSGKYRGAYQFDYRTWQSLGGTGDPAAASPAEQDLRAKMLYDTRGWRPWPECGRYLR